MNYNKNMMTNISMEQIRALFGLVMSTIISAFAPTNNFISAIVLMCFFNVWCGMRADGVAITRCKNFQWKKFGSALLELIMYTCVVEVIYHVTNLMGDGDYGLYAVKVCSYMIVYVYAQNSFKNLVKTYPTSMALWMIYLVIRLEFKKALPENIRAGIENYIAHAEKQKKEQEKKEQEKAKDNEEVHQ